ncbi:MAG: glycine--tRNA ligase subunit beta, partial [Pseudomonadota bacterium]
MSQLLLELLSEEIPARMQTRAAGDLRRLVTDGMSSARLAFGDAHVYVTPRRLTLVIEDVADGSEALVEERKGPRVGAPDKAVQGFLRGSGLASIDEAIVVSDAKKGDYYVARMEKPGQSASSIIGGLIPDVLRSFPWPKSMRWGEGEFTWVRPLQSILCVLDGSVVPFEVAGLHSGDE